MADLYGRSGIVDWQTAADWSLSDGGPADGHVPTSADDVHLTSNSGDMTLSAAGVCLTLDLAAGYTNTLDLATFNLTVGGLLSQGAGTLDAGSGDLSIKGWTKTGGTFNAETGKMIWGPGTYAADGETLNDLDTITSGNITIPGGETIIVAGTTTIITANTLQGGTLEMQGDLDVRPSGFSSPSTSMAFTGSAVQAVGSSTGEGALIGTAINKAGGSITFSDLINLYANGGGLFTCTAGAVAFDGTSIMNIIDGGTIDSDATWNDVIINTGGNVTIVGTWIIAGDFLMTAANLFTGGEITIGGDFEWNEASIPPGTTNLKLVGTGAQTITLIASADLPNTGDFIIDKASGIASLTVAFAPVAWAGDFLITAGTLDLAGFDLNIGARTLDIDDTLRLKGDEAITATVDLDVATSSVEFYDDAVTAVLGNLGELVFYNLTLGDAGGAKTHNFAAGSDYVVNGAFAANGTTGDKTLLRSTTPGTRFGLALSRNTYLLDVLDVKDCNTADGEFLYAIGSTDSGNNAGVIFLVTTRPVELTLTGAGFDAAKLGYKAGCAEKIMELTLLSVYTNDFSIGFGEFTEQDTGGAGIGAGNVRVVGGKLEIKGDGNWDANGVHSTSQQAIATPGKFVIEMTPRSASGNMMIGFNAVVALDFNQPNTWRFYPSTSGVYIYQAGGGKIIAALTIGTTYTLTFEWTADKRQRIYIDGGGYSNKLLHDVAQENWNGPISFQINVHTAFADSWEFDNYERFSGYATDDPPITLIDADGGDATSVWSMDSIRFLEDVAGLTFSYAEGDTPNPSNWSAYMTLANLRLESNPTARYFKLRMKVGSDGATQRSPSQGYILMDVAGAGGGRRPYVRRHSA